MRDFMDADEDLFKKETFIQHKTVQNVLYFNENRLHVFLVSATDSTPVFYAVATAGQG